MESNEDNYQLVFSEKKGQRYPMYKDDFNYNMYPMLSTMIVDVMKQNQLGCLYRSKSFLAFP